ncbi:hypothetical protein KJ877_03945 [bacterium]|nr:hypothetical protein [bacterium]MBU1989149.1 hypothetical protein [bacterium]
MSLKDNIGMVKEELNSEEKFFEKAVMTERFVKKYKNLMIGSLVAVVVVVAANIAYDINKQSKITSANAALGALVKDANNTQALTELKAQSSTLYDVWILSKAVADKDLVTLKELTGSKALIIGDIASYELAKDVKSLNNYASKQGVIYKDLALVQSAVLLMHEKKMDQAHQKLQMVSEDSSMSKIAKALLHYGVK